MSLSQASADIHVRRRHGPRLENVEDMAAMDDRLHDKPAAAGISAVARHGCRRVAAPWSPPPCPAWCEITLPKPRGENLVKKPGGSRPHSKIKKMPTISEDYWKKSPVQGSVKLVCTFR